MPVLPASMTTGPQGRLLALLLLLLVLGAVYLVAAAPLVELYSGRATDMEGKRMLVPRLKAAADELPELRTRAASLRTAAGTRKLTLEGASDAIASANLQNRIADIATSLGVTIGSAESLPVEARGGYRRIGLRVALNAPWPVLIELLRVAAQGQPRMLVDDLQLRSADLQTRTAATPVAASFTLLAFRTAQDGGGS